MASPSLLSCPIAKANRFFRVLVLATKCLPAGCQKATGLLLTPNSILRPLRAPQAEVIAQGLAFVVVPEETALLQFGHDEIDEILEALVEVGRHDVEPVRRALGEPFLQRVGDRRRRSAEHPVSARGGVEVVEIAQRHAVASGLRQDGACKGLASRSA